LLADAKDRVPASTPRMHASPASAPGVWTALYGGDAQGAADWMQHGLAHAGPPGSGTHALMAVGQVIEAYVRGDDDALAAGAAEADAALAGSGNRWCRTHVKCVLAMGKVRRGADDTREVIEELRGLLDRGRIAGLADRWPVHEERAADRRLGALTPTAWLGMRGPAGMPERAQHYGGEVDAGPAGDGGCRVSAVLPRVRPADARRSTPAG
jgi:hypothetical protein